MLLKLKCPDPRTRNKDYYVATAAAAVIIFIQKFDWNWLAVAGSLSFQAQMGSENLSFFKVRDVCGEVTHNYVLLFDALLLRGDFYIADCIAETPAIENVV